jgi:hypothetical protein
MAALSEVHRKSRYDELFGINQPQAFHGLQPQIQDDNDEYKSKHNKDSPNKNSPQKQVNSNR